MVLIQKLTLLLGHPTTSLVVSLSGILAGSGLGAYSVSRLEVSKTIFYGRIALTAVVCVVLLLRLALTPLIMATITAPFVLRVLTALLVVMTAGFLMGMPLPLGIRQLDRHPEDHKLVPWAWGLNGALSVLGSGVAMFLAIFLGFNTTLMVGATSYVMALAVLLTLNDVGLKPGTTDASG